MAKAPPQCSGGREFHLTLLIDDEPRRKTSRSRSWTSRACSLVAARLLLAVSLSLAASTCFGATPLLAEPALVRQLDGRTTLAWGGQELAIALGRLASVQRFPLWMDRRVDSHAAVEFSVNNATGREILDRLATDEAHQWGWTTLRTVVYFGPRETARELATLSEIARQAIAKEPADVRRRWLKPTLWEFPRLSEPRVLLADVLEAVGAEVQNLEAVPHDLWPARALPAVAPIDRVVLLLAGFDEAMSRPVVGGPLRVSPIRRPVQLERGYRFSERAAAATAELARQDRRVQVRRQGRRLVVTARWEDHEILKRALGAGVGATPDDAAPGDAAPRGERRFTLRITNKPVGPVLAQLGGQLQLIIAWDPALAIASPPADALVSCDVTEVDLDGLLEAILTPAGLAFTRDGQTVTIRAAK